MQLERVYLEAPSRDRVYEFAFIGGSLKLRGAEAAPIASDRSAGIGKD